MRSYPNNTPVLTTPTAGYVEYAHQLSQLIATPREILTTLSMQTTSYSDICEAGLRSGQVMCGQHDRHTDARRTFWRPQRQCHPVTSLSTVLHADTDACRWGAAYKATTRLSGVHWVTAAWWILRHSGSDRSYIIIYQRVLFQPNAQRFVLYIHLSTGCLVLSETERWLLLVAG